jgi:hypothetical protein
MGGFVVDLDDKISAGQPPFAQNVNRLTFTPKWIALLAKCGYLPLISPNDILDKSKIDGIGKILAWNVTFASDIEARLWRFYSLYIAFSGILCYVLHIIAQFSKFAW